MTTMATTATTTAMIVEVTGRQEEDNDADGPIVQERYGYHPPRAIYSTLNFIRNKRLSNLQLFYNRLRHFHKLYK